ncbi:hypothetical protein EsH8_VIII_000707 [Colletotrichum jinshuiense]
MFAVPGWSVSADALKSEKQGGQKDGTANKARKRKRANKDEKVTGSNVADLYENVIEGKDDGGKKRRRSDAGNEGKKDSKKDAPQAEADGAEEAATPKPSKKQKKEKKELPVNSEEQETPKSEKKDRQNKEKKNEHREEVEQETPKSEKKDKQKKKDKSNKQDRQEKKDEESASSETPQKAQKQKSKDDDKKKAKEAAAAIAAAAPPAPPTAAKLTPLQASMRQKLISARFRHLNETLYTRPSADAFQLFEDSPEMFSEYHEGFRRQVGVWPENPVDGYIRDIKLRAKQRTPFRGGGRPGAQPHATGPLPLPRTDGTCYIADLGCGDARLASTLTAEAKKLHLEILSYDLHSPAEHVVKADIANLPLANDSVDVAIFCLALMGTNWLDFIEEAYRILHWKGELWIAEIKSRFGPARSKNAVVSHSVGNRKKAAAVVKKGKSGAGPEETEADRVALAVEVDGHEDKRGETDVSAFIEALRKRGFVLQGEGEGNRGAVDLSNKMFVKMHFIKGAVPTKGKGLAAAKAAGFVEKEKKQKRFVWDTEEDKVDETAILKPCVYKIR